ncbi:MAG: tetratricopeptide repeat protein [Actinobacteria bacterium]|nr:tetratricopeptide repeat protein [Actinomycetota bacterium]
MPPRSVARRPVSAPKADEKLRRALKEAATAFNAERFRDARRVLRPLAERNQRQAEVRELYGLTLYRMGEWRPATVELEAFATLAGSTEQHPVLMDCHRAQRHFDDVEKLWDELRAASPSGELVTEGRIVMAGALADQGRLSDALRLLQRGPVEPKRPKDHHLRLWYALADLEERAGNLPRARTLFEQVRRRDATFADIAQRLAALG